MTTFTASVQSLPDQFAAGPNNELLVKSGSLALGDVGGQIFSVSTAGVATFYYNGAQVGTAMTGAVTAAADLTPTIAVSKTATAASMTMDNDYIAVSMLR